MRDGIESIHHSILCFPLTLKSMFFPLTSDHQHCEILGTEVMGGQPGAMREEEKGIIRGKDWRRGDISTQG